MEFQDTLRHQGLRKRLVEGIRIKGIKDEKSTGCYCKSTQAPVYGQQLSSVCLQGSGIPDWRRANH